ncbi:MAG: iron ABC transporter permease [Magnetococcus sp. DMHC-6]
MKHRIHAGNPSFLLMLALVFFVCAAFLLSLTTGNVTTRWHDLGHLLFTDGESLSQTVVLELRLPRALSGLAVGGLLALAGTLMQVLLRNPLADPYVLGLSGGASCAAIVALLMGLTGDWLAISSLGGALFTMLTLFYLANGPGGGSVTRLLLTGVVMSAGWGALISFLMYLSPDTQLRGIFFWLMGDLGYAERPKTALLILIVGLGSIWPFARGLNLLARGEQRAASLGVAVEQLRWLVYFLASLLTAFAVTTGGAIGFIGLLCPHLIRLLGFTDHRVLLPAAVLLGGGFLMLADTLARVILTAQQLPVGMVTALIGVPIFLFLLRKGPL